MRLGDIRFPRKDQQRGEAVYEYRSLGDDQFFDQSPVITLPSVMQWLNVNSSVLS